METIILNELQKNKKAPCVSIILSTHKKSSERTVDRIHLDQVVEKATELIKYKYGNNGNGSAQVIENLKSITNNIDFVHNDIGLGFFISPDFTRMVKFPFPVEEKIIVGNSFEIRDMLYLAAYLKEYYILSISEKGAKLLKAKAEDVTEIIDENFPTEFIDDYEYERPSLGNSYDSNALKSTEKDKSIVEEIRLIANLKNIDKKLSAYIDDETPLLIAGINKELGYFMKITKHEKFIAGKIKGDYNHTSLKEIGELAFEQIKIHQSKEEEKLLAKLDISIGKKLAAIGIEDVWKAAKEGKGLLLLVEKDYTGSGFIIEDNNFHPTTKNHNISTDPIDDIMEIVLEKDGKVVILDNGKLEKFKRIALLLRY